jgi:hypothetical protein
MTALDYLVLIGTIIGIASYGIWRTRGRNNLASYLQGDGKTRWFAIGLSVMATQASAVTFLSIPGQGYESGLGFVQIYFGMPIALIIIAAVFLPIYRRLHVYTAYEYLGRRFDTKTRLFGAAVFLLQRGIGAGITIYAPAIVLSTVMGWRLDLTIICSGLGWHGRGERHAKISALRHLRWNAHRGGRADLQAARRFAAGRRRRPGRAIPQTRSGKFFLQRQQPLHPLVGPICRHLSHAGLFRGRSIAGAALHLRRFAPRKPPRPDV